ncbi:hypothetical protein FQU23_006580 [Flavobacterium sp. XN-5]|uniref:hypothetical protein n=1 Tax=Flavobacterium sp. XN-5 TaxID=2599390 RepID=UPI0011C73BDF|nr:hypothetical protein [Flavobacterium sp. XN-5]NGY37179.1 hypothetical protein [Flavobacterium sp. XN-5]
MSNYHLLFRSRKMGSCGKDCSGNPFMKRSAIKDCNGVEAGARHEERRKKKEERRKKKEERRK